MQCAFYYNGVFEIGISLYEVFKLITDEELLSLIREYNLGSISFGEVLLISGKTAKEFAAFLKKHNIELEVNAGFLDEGRGLSEEELKAMLEGVS